MGLEARVIEELDLLEQNSVRLKLPKICMPTIAENSVIPFERIHTVLHEYGIMVIQLGYRDEPHGQTLESIVDNIGRAHGHDGSGRALWDIKKGGHTGAEALARSHRLNEFVLHADCCFEDPMPDHIGLNVVEPDRHGGGKNLLIDGLTLIQHLSDRALSVLQNEPVRIKVPPEFMKGVEAIERPVINENLQLRYRREIFDLTDASPELVSALGEFESLAYNTLINRAVLLEQGQILLLNNRRYLHARTEIKDPKRHLQRVRFFLDRDGDRGTRTSVF